MTRRAGRKKPGIMSSAGHLQSKNISTSKYFIIQFSEDDRMPEQSLRTTCS